MNTRIKNKNVADKRELFLLRLAYRRAIRRRRKEIASFQKEVEHMPSELAPNFSFNLPVAARQDEGLERLEQEILGTGPDRPQEGTAAYYKRFFDHFFHEDLYGRFDSENNIILSTGALDQNEMRLPDSLKYAIDFALANNWYGYSCSLGRESAREAIADLEKIKTNDESLSCRNVALVKGVTDGLYHLISFLKEQSDSQDFCILTHLPTYIPFATACEKIARTKFVDLHDIEAIDIDRIVANIDEQVKVLLLLSDFNPLGKALSTDDVNRLADFCKERRVYLVVDEAGAKYPETKRQGLEHNPYLIRLESLSKKISVPGMKLGYFIADADLVERFYERASTCYGGPASFFYLLQEFEARFDAFLTQDLAVLDRRQLSLFDPAYGLSLSWLQLLYDDYRLNRQYFFQKIELQRSRIVSTLRCHQPALVDKIVVPETGINVFVKLNSNLHSYELFRKLLIAKGVAVFPGICSGLRSGCWVRITAGVASETLTKGLAAIVDFMKEEFIAETIAADSFYKRMLTDWGGYGQFKNIDFSAHLYDVCRNISFLRGYLSVAMQPGADSDLLDLAMCHDAGKVASVLAWRMHRVLRLQRRYTKVPRRILDRWRDEDLLGHKTELARGAKISIDNFYDRFPFMKNFELVIDWGIGRPQEDMVFTKFILERLSEEVDGSIRERAVKALATMMKDIDGISLGAPLSPSEACVVLLDISDKLADFDLTRGVTRKQIAKYLMQKKRYAAHRYAKADGLSSSSIVSDFRRAAGLVDSWFIFSPDKMRVDASQN